MIHQPPAGARDLLPLEVAQKCWINDRIQEVFRRWGYQRIVTSTLEWLDTLMAGGAIAPSSVIQLHDADEGTLGLRPELTASIARASVTRMGGITYPQRLCYRANVFRRPPRSSSGRQVEFYQAGVELLGAGGMLADAEILLLLVDCLNQLGIPNWQLILGELGLTRSLLSPFPKAIRKQVRYCIAHLDRIRLESLPLSPELRERALFIFDLRGKPEDVLQKVATLELDTTGQESVSNLKSLIELINQTQSSPLPITLDLSLLQTIDYYTGIVFEVVTHTETEELILGQGGRYDHLLELYSPEGKSTPGIGFALNVEDLHTCLLPTTQLPNETPGSDWLVIPTTPQAQVAAFNYARTLRDAEHIVGVEIELEGRTPEQVREYAANRRITYLAWIDEAGTPTLEVV
ncbi:MAG: ATP phosphoribosyltransferase regulatory subunit [Chroococcales cyanobacterium]